MPWSSAITSTLICFHPCPQGLSSPRRPPEGASEHPTLVPLLCPQPSRAPRCLEVTARALPAVPRPCTTCPDPTLPSLPPSLSSSHRGPWLSPQHTRPGPTPAPCTCWALHQHPPTNLFKIYFPINLHLLSLLTFLFLKLSAASDPPYISPVYFITSDGSS